MKPRESMMLRVTKGALVPADPFTAKRIVDKGIRVGDVLSADLRKARNPRFHRLVHAFAAILADNLERFEGMDAHKVIKALQWEANIGCEELAVNMPNVGMVNVRIPRSLSFVDMDEAEFSEIYRGLCRHVAKVYWPTMTPEEVEVMAEMAREAA